MKIKNCRYFLTIGLKLKIKKNHIKSYFNKNLKRNSKTSKKKNCKFEPIPIANKMVWDICRYQCGLKYILNKHFPRFGIFKFNQNIR